MRQLVKKCIVKKITSDDEEKIAMLGKNLRRQVRFSEIWMIREDKDCLFEQGRRCSYVAFTREWKNWQPLKKYCQKRFSIAESISLILEIPESFKMAHAHNFSNGDSKTCKIMWAWRVKLLSLTGIVWASTIGWWTHFGRQNHYDGEVSGTPSICRLKFQGQKIDPQFDIYRLCYSLSNIDGRDTFWLCRDTNGSSDGYL